MGCRGSKKAADATEPSPAKACTENPPPADSTEPAAVAKAVAPPAGAADCTEAAVTGDVFGTATACEETDQPAAADDTDRETFAPGVSGGSVTDTTGPAVAELAPIAEPELPFQERRFKELAAVSNVPANKASSQPRRPSSSGVMLSDYVAKHADAFEEVKRMEPMEGWTFKKEEDGVKIYLRAEPDMPVYSFKGVTEFPVGPGGIGEILYGLLDVERRPEWDEMCIFGNMIETYVPFYRVTHVAMRAPVSIISERDLLILGRLRFEEDGSIIVQMKSCEHPDVPETSKYVRVNFIKGGYIIRPTSDPSKVQVTWAGCVQPNGWLPSFLVNAVAWKQALTLAKFKKQRLSGN